MRFLRPTRAWLVCVLLAAPLLVAVSAMASGGREFTGYFDVSGVKEQGDSVQVTLHLKLFNHGDADARSVIVTLLDSGPGTNLQGNFRPLRVWKSGHFIEMSQEFTINKREFRQWMGAAAQPNVMVLYQDANGHSWQKGVLLSRRPLVPVDQPE